MEQNHIDTIIVGGGPAGSTCGYLLAKHNKECLIIDRKAFPRDKLCGGGLTPKAVRLLDEIYGNLNYDYYQVNKMEVYDYTNYLNTFHMIDGIRTVSRKDFDMLLHKEYLSAGGKFMVGTVSDIEEKNDRVYVVLRDGQRYSCNRLIAADGANSIVRKYVQPGYKKGILYLEEKTDDKSIRNIRIFLGKKFRNGYMYAFPNNNGLVSGCGYTGTRIQNLRKALEDAQIASHDKIKGAYIPMYVKLDYRFGKNIILIGDAGSYVDSISGEGIYYAIKTGQNAALSIINKEDFTITNAHMIKRMEKTRKFAILFYSPFFLKIFFWACRHKKWNQVIEQKLNEYLIR